VCDEEWIVRIGPALSGTATVLLTAWLGAALLGRVVGVLGGLVLATMYQFVRYSTLAEADMFLAPIVAGCFCLLGALGASFFHAQPDAPPVVAGDITEEIPAITDTALSN